MLYRIDTEEQAAYLVDLLRSPDRAAPIVVVSTRNGESEPVIDAVTIANETRGVADVYVVRTGRSTWAMAALMAEGSHVFGGAGRVYPTGRAWETDLGLSPLRFAYGEHDARASTEKLIDDAHAAVRAPVAKPFTQSLGESFAALRDFVPLAADADAPAVTVTAMNTLSTTPTGPAAVAAAAARPVTGETMSPKSGRALQDAQLALATARAAADGLAQDLEAEQLRAQQELDAATRSLRIEVAELEHRLVDQTARHAEQLQAARRRGSRAPEASPCGYAPELFADAESAVRHAVYLTWVDRVPAGEKAAYALPHYAIGSEFASSLSAFDESQKCKAFKCVVDVLTDLARDNTSRRVHPLRTGVGGDDKPLTRADGAVCYRANIEDSTASARRLHYWKLPDGSFELSRVVTHDDMNP